MAKVIFVLQRRADLTREQSLSQWSGEQHAAIVRKVPGLARWVQNHVSSASADPVCDGIGELWFPSDEQMNAALNSPEMAEAVEDAKRFLDMERTGMILVEEKTLAGLPQLTSRTAATHMSPACRVIMPKVNLRSWPGWPGSLERRCRLSAVGLALSAGDREVGGQVRAQCAAVGLQWAAQLSDGRAQPGFVLCRECLQFARHPGGGKGVGELLPACLECHGKFMASDRNVRESGVAQQRVQIPGVGRRMAV
jgi:uncharacterized protein (TIGR02118 family)